MMMDMWTRLEAHPDFPQAHVRSLRHLRAVACRNHAWIAVRLNSSDRRWVARQIRLGLTAEPWQVFHPRSLATLAMIVMPSPLRTALNRLGNRMRGTREETNLVHDY